VAVRLRGDVGRGVQVVDREVDWRVVELDHARAEKALAPQVARPAVEVHQALILRQQNVVLEAGNLLVGLPLAAGIVGLSWAT
jgi:hypothetical protein